MDKLIPLIRTGNAEAIKEGLSGELHATVRARLIEEKRRLANQIFENAAVPNTKGSVDELHQVLVDHGYKKTREGAGVKNDLGKTTIHDYRRPVGREHFRLHQLVKHDGSGQHVGWAEMKQKLGETTPRPVKQGTGVKSLSTHLKKLHGSELKESQAQKVGSGHPLAGHRVLEMHGFKKVAERPGFQSGEVHTYEHPAGHTISMSFQHGKDGFGWSEHKANRPASGTEAPGLIRHLQTNLKLKPQKPQ